MITNERLNKFKADSFHNLYLQEQDNLDKGAQHATHPTVCVMSWNVK